MRDYTNLDKFLDERVWDAHPNYDYANTVNEYVAETSVNRLFKDFGLEKASRVLDVGCGDGRDMKTFQKLGAIPYGLNFLQIDLDKVEEGMFKVLGDQSFIPFDNEYFDCVYSRHCLEHSIMPYFTLVEYNRVLKNGGLCYIELPCPDTLEALHETNPNHYSVMGKRMWEQLFERTGFKVQEYCEVTFDFEERVIDKWMVYFLKKEGLAYSGFFRDPEMIKKYGKS